MLVLTRKPGERIHIGEDIWVEVRRIAGNRVTLAIEAPDHVHILRGELERFPSEVDEDNATLQEAAYRVEQYRIARSSSDSRRLETANV